LSEFLRGDDDAAGAPVYAERGAERDDGQEFRARQARGERVADGGCAFRDVCMRNADTPAACRVEPSAQELAVAAVKLPATEQRAPDAEPSAWLDHQDRHQP
jgi:hypothetical protein